MRILTIKNFQKITNQPLAEMPSELVILIGLLAVSPLSSSLLFDRAIPLPANLATLFGLVNSLILERYFYRGVMTVGYIIQYHSKILAAIPVALQIMSEAIDRIITALFAVPEYIYFYSHTMVVKVEGNLKVNNQKSQNSSGLNLAAWYKTVCSESRSRMIFSGTPKHNIENVGDREKLKGQVFMIWLFKFWFECQLANGGYCRAGSGGDQFAFLIEDLHFGYTGAAPAVQDFALGG
jgi:hypothetical protein